MSAAWLVLASLFWTGLVALGADLASKSRVTPLQAQSIWRGAAVLMVLPWFVAGVSMIWPQGAGLPLPELESLPAVAGSALGAVSEAQTSVQHVSALGLGQIVLGVLIVGWIWRLGTAFLAQVRLQRLKRVAVLESSPSERAALEKWSQRLGLKTVPQIARMGSSASPFIAGIQKRTIYLPQKLDCHVTSELILAHECVHLARGDLMTRPLERLVADLLWFSPFAWIARSRLDYLREAVCDVETVAMTGERAAYARALTHVARSVGRSGPLPVSAFILRRKSSLPKRVHGILGATDPKHGSRSSLMAMVVAMIAAPLAIAQGLQFEHAVIKPDFASVIVEHPDAKISSPYGMRVDPWGKEAVHKGIDIAAPKGVDVKTPAAGEVVYTGFAETHGWHLKVRFSDGTKMRFSNLGSIEVSEGDRVEAGAVIGIIGVSGRSTGPHVHVEYWRPDVTSEGHNWQAHDPKTIEGLDLVCNKGNENRS